MVIIPEQVYAYENKAKIDTWTRASEFMENFQSQMWLEICTRWFGLADYTTLYHEVEQFFINMMNPTNGLRYYERDGLIIPMIEVKSNILQEGMIFDDNRRSVQDVYYQPNYTKWGEWRTHAIAYPNQQF